MKTATIVQVAYILAFTFAGLTIISALIGEIILLPIALIPLGAGIGIMRGRVWSAYGLALYQFTQLCIIPVWLFRHANVLTGPLGIAAAVSVVLIPLFFLAGRSLAQAGADRGWAWPWITISALLALPLVFGQTYVIPTSSMEDTLLVGDHILVQCWPGPNPVRGEIAVFIYAVDRSQTFIKRIVGASGDRIRIAHKIAYRNGVALNEPYVVHKSQYEDTYRDNFPSKPNVALANAAQEMLKNHVVNGEVVVPTGKYFVLGDNRDSSLDSRYFGFVDSDDFLGRPVLIYDSHEQPVPNLVNGIKPRLSGIRWGRILTYPH